MGCAESSQKGTAPPAADTSKNSHFTEQDDEKPHRKMSSHLGIFSGFALKFPLVRASFKQVRSVFQKYAHTGDLINVKRLGELLGAMGAKNLSDKDIQQLFNLADLDHSKSISFREFLIAIAIGYYLREDTPKDQQGADFEETRKGFKVVETFFKKIDRDNGGSVDPQELKAALFEASSEGGISQEILEARFKELDFNGDGDIEFPEFLYCMTKWVMGDDDEEEDPEEEEEERQTEENTKKNEEHHDD